MTVSNTLSEFLRGLSLAEYVVLFGSREDPETRMRVPFNPWVGQIGFMNWTEGRKECWVPKARQLGISEIAAEKVVKSALELPGGQYVIISKNEPDAMYFLSDRVVPKLQGLPPVDGIEWAQIVSISQKKIVLSNGSIIHSLPAGNASGASRTLNGWIVDEAGGIDTNPQAKFALLYKNLKPTIEKAKSSGWGWVIGTSEPGSFFNEMLYRQYLGKAPRKYYFLSWRTDPSRNEEWKKSQLLEYEVEADFKNQYPENMEEFFAVRTGAVFPDFDPRYGGKHVRDFDPNWGHEYLVAYDHGFRHYAALIHTLYDNTRDMLYVFKEQVWKETVVSDIVADILDFIRKTPRPPSSMLADTDIFKSDGRRAVGDIFRERGVRFQPAWKSEEEASRALLSDRIKNNKILIHPSCLITIQQLTNYTWRSSGNSQKPQDRDDDTIDCLRYICAHIVRREARSALINNVKTKVRGYKSSVEGGLKEYIYSCDWLGI